MHLLRLKRHVDELTLQEERQRALLQMQWRVMSDKAPEEQEVSSRKVRPRIILIHWNNTLAFTVIYLWKKHKHLLISKSLIIILQEYSVSSVKVRGSRPPISRKSQHTTVMLDEDEQVGNKTPYFLYLVSAFVKVCTYNVYNPLSWMKCRILLL